MQHERRARGSLLCRIKISYPDAVSCASLSVSHCADLRIVCDLQVYKSSVLNGANLEHLFHSLKVASFYMSNTKSSRCHIWENSILSFHCMTLMPTRRPNMSSSLTNEEMFQEHNHEDLGIRRQSKDIEYE